MIKLSARIATVPTLLVALATSAHADSESQGWSWSNANDHFGAYLDLDLDASVEATTCGELCTEARRAEAVSPQVGVALHALGQRTGGLTRNASNSTMPLMPLPSIASEAKSMAGPVPLYVEAGVFGAMGANLEASRGS